MKKALSLVMVFLVAVAFSATGYSADKYISGAAGISWMNDSDIEDVAGIVDVLEGEIEMDYGSGFTAIGAFGCDYGDYRVEGEIGYQSGDVDGISADFSELVEIHDWDMDPSDAKGSLDLDGDVQVLSLMVNGYYDISLGSGVELSPYVGVGVAQVSLDDVKYAGDIVPDGQHPEDLINELNLDVHETTLAYQAGVVLGFEIADNIMLDAKYRYFATTDFSTLALINTNVDSHSALLGLRFGI
ncbi:porin family protein [Prosthecochloris sp. N3]|uniref:Porin family protein n=1 Tax=Prosthecochloris ethylica TaxID=2743976 RepID=A0ABR9XSA4_9CHLB|nr:outer membrane beta-barrel protein [Prosthecochloris ethylica]MBF0586829.1 porin family protein [Prosthecochloris ethylica]MBF0636823.1 porin family protein [Prosthecochloris ethylica]NUK48039.1 porin family protein [Prosthecochloris ethylica]